MLTKVQKTEIFSANYTHNVTNMWKKAGVYNALYNSQGKKAKDIIKVLERGIKRMKAKPEIYKALNSDNGWGSYETALPWLIKVLEACKLTPTAKIDISK